MLLFPIFPVAPITSPDNSAIVPVAASLPKVGNCPANAPTPLVNPRSSPITTAELIPVNAPIGSACLTNFSPIPFLLFFFVIFKSS